MIVLEDQVKLKIQSAINEYFEMKKDKNGKLILQFKKNCLMGNFELLADRCLYTVLKRIRLFVAEVKNALGKTTIPKEFKLNQVDLRVTPDSILSAVSFISDQFISDIDDVNIPSVNDLVKMCTPNPYENPEANTPDEYYALEASRERAADEFEDKRRLGATSGGRRSRYRRRPTKKYFKSRRHSSHKKKRHMKTKRHMKRHRKTKRH
jgi:hypothetical protein